MRIKKRTPEAAAGQWGQKGNLSMNSITDTSNHESRDILQENKETAPEEAEKPTAERFLRTMEQLRERWEKHGPAMSMYYTWLCSSDMEALDRIDQGESEEKYIDVPAIRESFSRIISPINEMDVPFSFSDPHGFQYAEKIRFLAHDPEGEDNADQIRRLFVAFIAAVSFSEIITFIEWIYPEFTSNRLPVQMNLSYADTGKDVFVPYEPTLNRYIKGTEAARAREYKIQEDPIDKRMVQAVITAKNGEEIVFALSKDYVESHPETIPAIEKVFLLMSSEIYSARSNPMKWQDMKENGIFISAREYAGLLDPNPDEQKDDAVRYKMAKSAKKELAEIAEFLFYASSIIEDKNGVPMKMHVLRKFSDKVRGGVLIVPEDDVMKKLADKILVFHMSANAFKIDKRHETAWQIFEKLSRHAGQDYNIKRGIDKKIPVSKLLEKIERIPTYETVMKQEKKRPKLLIIDPLIRALDYLQDNGYIKYHFLKGKKALPKNELPSKYTDFIRLDLYFEIVGVDNRKRVAKKKDAKNEERRRSYAKNRAKDK